MTHVLPSPQLRLKPANKTVNKLANQQRVFKVYKEAQWYYQNKQTVQTPGLIHPFIILNGQFCGITHLNLDSFKSLN